MVIIAGNQGQFCNQLFRVGHHIAHGLQYGYEVNCADFKYDYLFPLLSKHTLVSTQHLLPSSFAAVFKLSLRKSFQAPMRFLFKQMGYVLVNQPYSPKGDDDQFVKQAINQRVIATHWEFRDFDTLNRQYAAIEKLFSFSNDVQQQATQLLQVPRQQGEVVVGVHLRRGDYATWNGGVYYYNDAAYAAMMAHITSLFPSRSVSFLLCSNEPIKLSSFDAWPTAVSNCHFTVDLTALSQCDLLIGPPSTFSLWASFVGRVPFYHMHRYDAKPVLSDFTVARG